MRNESYTVTETVSIRMFLILFILLFFTIFAIFLIIFILLTGPKEFLNYVETVLALQSILIIAIIITLLIYWIPYRKEYTLENGIVIIRMGLWFKMRREFLLKDIENMRPIEISALSMVINRPEKRYFKNNFSAKHSNKLYLVDLKENYTVIKKDKSVVNNPPEKRIAKYSYDLVHGRYLTIPYHVVEKFEENGYYILRRKRLKM